MSGGRHAAGVTVKAAPLGGGTLATVLPHTRTDANGRFALAGLLAGRTYVNAYDEQAFYPDASSNFWDGQGGAEIELPVGGEVSDIVLRLTPVGRLEIKARNAVTGEIIGQTGARLERDGAPNRCMSGGRQGNWWLVPTAPIRLLVMAGAGFQPAWYGGDGSFEKSVPITLARRQVFTARVSLRPRSWHDPASHVFVAQPAAALFR